MFFDFSEGVKLKINVMIDKNKHKADKQRDLESGDNPAERSRISGSGKRSHEGNKNEERDLESGDNPEERRRISGK